MQDRIKGVANETVMGLLFASLLVIYLVVPYSNLITFLCLVILVISLIIAVTSDWQELRALAIFSVAISLVAAYFLGNTLRFGMVTGVLFTVIWALILFFSSQRFLKQVQMISSEPDAPAYLVSGGAVARLYIASPPMLVPGLQKLVAVIPRRLLIHEVEIQQVEAQNLKGFEKIVVQVRYQITDPIRAYLFTPTATLQTAANEMDKALEAARLDTLFWEQYFSAHLVRLDVTKVVRDVVLSWPASPKEQYQQREEIEAEIRKRVEQLFTQWGASLRVLELDQMVVVPEFVAVDPERRRKDELLEAKHQAMIEATRVRLMLSSEVEAEAERVKAIVEALRESNLDVNPDVVIRAMRASPEWANDNEYATIIDMARPKDLK
jgi:hypothetical protein